MKTISRSTGKSSPGRSHPLSPYLFIAICLMALTAFIEWKLGRVPISKSGRLMLWVGDVNSNENSQQLSDWYSFSHIIHGFIFYGVFRLISRGKWPLGLCLVLTIFVESSWEVFENTSFIINRYREATISLGYYGDSILNSMSDITCCIIGFTLARLLPVWITLALAALMEAGVAYMIHDNLLLNIIMLIHPFEAIKHWQMSVG